MVLVVVVVIRNRHFFGGIFSLFGFDFGREDHKNTKGFQDLNFCFSIESKDWVFSFGRWVFVFGFVLGIACFL